MLVFKPWEKWFMFIAAIIVVNNVYEISTCEVDCHPTYSAKKQK